MRVEGVPYRTHKDRLTTKHSLLGAYGCRHWPVSIKMKGKSHLTAHSIGHTSHMFSCTLAAILQRVLSASVTVEKELVSSIGKGVLVFAAMAPGDTEKDAESLANKVLKLRLWDDENGGRVLFSLNSHFPFGALGYPIPFIS